MSEPDFRGLDNPFWTSLATRHAHIAEGGAFARRYLPEISVLAGVSGSAPANVAALSSLVAVDEEIVLVGVDIPRLPSGWETLHNLKLTQMLRADRTPLPEGDEIVTTLGPSDVPEMAALVELTHPGPFRKRTIELGTYIGIRER